MTGITEQEMHAQVSVLDDEQLAIALSTATNDFAEQVRVMDERERAYLALGKGTEARAAAQASYHEASNQTNCQSQWLTALRREQEYRRAGRPRGPGRPRIHQEPRQDVRVSLPVDLIAQIRAASQVGEAAPNLTAFVGQAVRRALVREVWLIGLVNDWFAIRAERTDDGLWSPVVTRKRTGEDVYIGGEDDPDSETYAEAIDQGEQLLRDQVERGNI